ncbi:MAG: hypothetical protein K2I49_01640 [Ureaplasma sp.]|nr:hypothetical protein [Ureaplasma sp.]
MLFDKYKTKSKNKKTLRDIINSLYEEFDKKILSEESKVYLKSKIGINI